MLFVVIGVLLIGMNLGGVWFPGEWTWSKDWWKMLWPFAAALAWWIWADSTGLTKKREMDKMEAKKAERRRQNLENLGLHDPRKKSQKNTVSTRQRVAEKVEAKRSRIREHNKEVVRHSRLDSEQSSGFESQPPAKG